MDYYDRLMEWNTSAHKRGHEARKNGTNYRSAKNALLYLEAYHEAKIDLMAIASGVDRSNGFEYYIYFYDVIK